MSPQEPQRPDIDSGPEEQVAGPFSFDVDIELGVGDDTPATAGSQLSGVEIPAEPAEPPRYWPDDLFEPLDHREEGPVEEAKAELRADRALPPASPLPAPTGTPVEFEPPREGPVEVEAPESPRSPEVPGEVEVEEDYLEPVEPLEAPGLPPLPEAEDAVAVELPAEISDVPRIPSLPSSQRLALPEARVEKNGVKNEKPVEPLLRRLAGVATSPLTTIEKARSNRLESRRMREASKTVEQREKERKKREERRARRRKKEEKRRNRDAAKKRKADDRRTAKLRKEESVREKSRKTEAEVPEEKQTTRIFGLELGVPELSVASLPFIGRRLAARAAKTADPAPKKVEAVEDAQPDFSARVAGSFRRRTNRFRSSLQRNVIGLDVGASHLRAVRIKDGIPVEIHVHQLPEGIIVNGLLEEPDELVEEIKRFWKLSGLRSKKVNFSLSNRMVTMRTKRLPAKHPDDIPQAVAMNAEELIYPMDPKESVLDYAEMSRSGPMSDLQITAADEDMAKAYSRAVEKAGLVSVSCELGTLAAARAVVIPRSPTRSHALINVGAEVSWMAVASGPDVYFMRIIDIGGNDFTRAIADLLGIGFLEAEGLKKRCGLGTAPTDPELDAAVFIRCREAMRKVSDHLCQELAQTKRYWDEGRPERVISSWSLMGGGGRLVGLKEQIAVFAGLQGPEALVAFPGFEGAENLDLNATALGLARGNTMSLLPENSMKDTNVAIPGLRRRSKVSLSRSRREGKRLAAGRKGQHASAKTLAILGCVVFLGGGWYLRMGTEGKIDDAKTALDSAEATLAAAKKQPKPSAGEGGSPTYVNSPQASSVAAQITSSSTSAISAVNTALTLVGAQDVQIQAKGTTVTVTGTVAASSGVTQLTKLLQSNPDISQASVKAQSPGAGGTGFTIQVVSRS